MLRPISYIINNPLPYILAFPSSSTKLAIIACSTGYPIESQCPEREIRRILREETER